MTIIQMRRDTASNWTTVNPVLASGELGVETDTNKFKIGDGVTAWNTLDYQGGGGDLSNYYTKTETNELLEEKADDFIIESPLKLEAPTTSTLSFYTYNKGEVNYNYETGEYYYGFASDRTMFQIIIDIPEDINIDVYSDYWRIGDSSTSFSKTQPNNSANNNIFEIYANNGTNDVIVSRLWYGSGNYRLGSTTNTVFSPFGESLGIHQANTTAVNMKSSSVEVSRGYESNIVSGSRLSKIKLYCMCQCTGSWGTDFSSASWGNYWSDSSGARFKSLKLYTSPSDTVGTELISYSASKPVMGLKIDNSSLILNNNILATNSDISGGNIGMPSATVIPLTLGASGTTYTAPTNGYFVMSKNATTANKYVFIDNGGVRYINYSTTSNQGLIGWVPVRKNGSVTINYNAEGSTNFFHFVPSVGSESEVS